MSASYVTYSVITLPAEECQLANVSILRSRERVLVLLTAWLYV